MVLIVYIDLVILLNFLVDFLLLLAVNRYCGTPSVLHRALLGGLLGGVYGGICLLPGLLFLGSALWRVVFLVLIGIIAFGLRRSSVRKILLFSVFSTTLGGFVLLMESGNFLTVVLCAGALVAAGVLIPRKVNQKLAAVELRKGNRYRKFLALRDTGNTLCDPLTGTQVLVAGANIAREILDISPQQLQRPDAALLELRLKGGRLVPFRTIQNGSGFLLAVPMDAVFIDGVPTNSLVAFSPMEIGAGEDYEALTGGNV